VRSARELFQHEVEEMYDGTQRLVEALGPMGKKVSHPDVSKMLDELRTATEEQVRRLEETFQLMGEEPRRSESKIMKGFIDSFSSFVSEEKPEKEALDLEAAEVASDVASYLMDTWEAMLLLAERSGVSSAAPKIGDFLHVSHKEEKKLSKDIGKLLEPLIELLPAA
jgi:ferritin-like metal-binding protein YciE